MCGWVGVGVWVCVGGGDWTGLGRNKWGILGMIGGQMGTVTGTKVTMIAAFADILSTLLSKIIYSSHPSTKIRVKPWILQQK